MYFLQKNNLRIDRTTDAHRLTQIIYLCASVFICGFILIAINIFKTGLIEDKGHNDAPIINIPMLLGKSLAHIAWHSDRLSVPTPCW